MFRAIRLRKKWDAFFLENRAVLERSSGGAGICSRVREHKSVFQGLSRRLGVQGQSVHYDFVGAKHDV